MDERKPEPLLARERAMVHVARAGRSPQLYAVYVDESDRVWASEWEAQVMLRFDPATEKFEVFRSSSRTANVRQIHGRRGEVWTAESATDKVVVYRTR